MDTYNTASIKRIRTESQHSILKNLNKPVNSKSSLKSKFMEFVLSQYNQVVNVQRNVDIWQLCTQGLLFVLWPLWGMCHTFVYVYKIETKWLIENILVLIFNIINITRDTCSFYKIVIHSNLQRKPTTKHNWIDNCDFEENESTIYNHGGNLKGSLPKLYGDDMNN